MQPLGPVVRVRIAGNAFADPAQGLPVSPEQFVGGAKVGGDGVLARVASLEGEQQALRLRIEKTTAGQTEVWDDEHPMVAVSFAELQALLAPYFEVQVLEHDYQRLAPWDGSSGNALFACVKRL